MQKLILKKLLFARKGEGSMGFSEIEKQCLLEVNGVGSTVISRLEQLNGASYDEILISGTALTGSSLKCRARRGAVKSFLR